MNKFYTLLVALVITASTFAQAPEKMSYQAVVRDSGDNLVTSQVVGMQISILKDAVAIYIETQTPMTNANGLVSINIGDVNPTAFADIDWSAGTYSIKTEIDPAGPLTNYTITGTSELLSVPYALHATNGQDSGTNAGDMQYWNGSSWDVVAATPNEGATLQMIGGLPTWVGGTPPPPAIGDIRDGGVVFWLDGNGGGLVCAFSDFSNLRLWGCHDTDLSNVPNVPYNYPNPPTGFGAEIGDGIDNTNNILNDCPSAPTALAARFLGPEWFLPSANELNQMYINKTTLEAVAGFSAFSLFYWSSSEISTNNAWLQWFDNGFQASVNKYTQNYVRAVRAF
jgi:hypothetical protein